MRELNSPSRAPNRILFVDDEPSVLSGLARSLRSASSRWELDFAPDGNEALDRVRNLPYQVVVSDMQMPGMSGAELLQQIQQISPECVRLMLTGRADLDTALTAVNQGRVFHLLLKPCEHEQLIGSLEMAVRQYELQTVERTLLRAQLEHSQKMANVGEFTAGIVHDVNNILAAISGLSGSDGLFEPRQAMGIIHESVQRAAELTRELMCFSRRDEDLPLEPIDLGSVVEACVKLLRPMLGHQIHLRPHIPADLPPIWGHASKLKQIITNLVINARDAAPKGGEIQISADQRQISPAEVAGKAGVREGDFVCLAVTDTGCGMSETTRKRLFEPFFTTKGSGQGTGLGLALVRQLVEHHCGWIEVESVLGAGSTFRIFLPRLPETGDKGARSQ